MYNKQFCKIYNEYGWNYFSLTMGKAILDYFKENHISIHNHLDLCSGTGDLCKFFYEKGLQTKGVDLSEEMIKISKNKFPFIDFSCCDVLKYVDDNKYNLVTCTCDSINHILDNNDLKKLFTNVYNFLGNNGYFIFDAVDRNTILFNQNVDSIRENGIKVVYYLTELPNTKMNMNIKVYDKNTLIHEENIIEKLYSSKELIQLLEDIGFEIEKCDKQILDEEQRLQNKIYMIAKRSKV